MKKFLTVLLVLVVAMGFVFADDNEATNASHSLNLSASVGSVMAAHWAAASSGTPTLTTWDTASFTTLDGNTSSPVSVSLTNTGLQPVGNFVYKTNNTTLASFKIAGTVFSATGVDTTIGYDIYKTGTSTSLVAAGASEAATLIAESGDTAKSGLRFGSQDVSIKLVSDDVAKAAQGSYSAELTVTTVAI
jgi:hypothetical protein